MLINEMQNTLFEHMDNVLMIPQLHHVWGLYSFIVGEKGINRGINNTIILAKINLQSCYYKSDSYLAVISFRQKPFGIQSIRQHQASVELLMNWLSTAHITYNWMERKGKNIGERRTERMIPIKQWRSLHFSNMDISEFASLGGLHSMQQVPVT